MRPIYAETAESLGNCENAENAENAKNVENAENDYSITRRLQSVIEMLDAKNDDEHNETAIFQINRLTIMTFAKEKYLDIIYPYTLLKVNQKNMNKHRAICFILSQMSADLFGISLDLYPYLVRILNESTDQWTVLYALFCLQNLLIGLPKEKIQELNVELHAILDRILDRVRPKFAGNNVCGLLYDCTNNLDYRLYVVAQWFRIRGFRKLAFMKLSSINETSITDLCWADNNAGLIFSPDLLSVCSYALCMDSSWKNARSLGAVSVSKLDGPKLCYFEVVLLTSGEMRICWATKNEINFEPFGEDEYSFCFDGFHQEVVHEGKKYETNDKRKWKAGDVIGCLLDRTTKSKKSNTSEKAKFRFYLNGEEINFYVDYYVSSLPYYAAVSLKADQQCYFNFGPNFRYPPKRMDYQSFGSIAKVIEGATKNILPVSQNITNINLSNSNLRNVLMNVNSEIRTRDIIIVESSSSTDSSTLNIDNNTIDMSVLETTSHLQIVDGKSEEQIPGNSNRNEGS